MPSYSYLEDPIPKESNRYTLDDGSSPEPPSRYDPNQNGGESPYQQQGPEYPDASVPDIRSLRRFITIAQVMAIVSLLIGGVLLSTASIVVAIMGYRKALAISHPSVDARIQQALVRSATLSIVLGIAALALNAIALVVLYPVAMEMLQSGDLGALGAGSQQAVPSGSGSGHSTWG